MAVNKVTLKENNGEVRTLIDISGTTATAGTVRSGYKFYGADGNFVTGTYTPTYNTPAIELIPSETSDSGEQYIRATANGKTSQVLISSLDGDFKAANIKKDVVICGVKGEYQGASSLRGCEVTLNVNVLNDLVVTVAYMNTTGTRKTLSLSGKKTQNISVAYETLLTISTDSGTPDIYISSVSNWGGSYGSVSRTDDSYDIIDTDEYNYLKSFAICTTGSITINMTDSEY